MTELFRLSGAGWVAALILLVPLIIVATNEVEERLRQRDSKFRPAVSIVRRWVVPLAALWALIRVVFDADVGASAIPGTEVLGGDNVAARVVATALVIALSAAALSATRVAVALIRDRPRAEGRLGVPRLLLAVPRLAVLLVTAWVLIDGVWALDVSATLAAFGVTSLVISFALQQTLGGIASGFTLLADQPFQPGDWIHIGDQEKDQEGNLYPGPEGMQVVDVNWRSSRLRTRNGDLVAVPNSELASATITNFDEPSRVHRVVVDLKVAFRNPPTNAKEMLLAAARVTPGVLDDPEPLALITEADDPLMAYQVHLWIDDFELEPQVRSDFASLVWYHSHRHDVPLPSPAQDLYLWDGKQIEIEGRPTHATLLQGLRRSHLLEELDDDDLDALANAASSKHFAGGETIVDDPAAKDLRLLKDGRARLVLYPDDGSDPISVVDLEAGDLFSMQDHLEDSPHRVAAVAVTDCRVLTVPALTAGEVISRSRAVTTSLEKLELSRRRRISRVLRHALADDTEAEDLVHEEESW